MPGQFMAEQAPASALVVHVAELMHHGIDTEVLPRGVAVVHNMEGKAGIANDDAFVAIGDDHRQADTGGFRCRCGGHTDLDTHIAKGLLVVMVENHGLE